MDLGARWGGRGVSGRLGGRAGGRASASSRGGRRRRRRAAGGAGDGRRAASADAAGGPADAVLAARTAERAVAGGPCPNRWRARLRSEERPAWRPSDGERRDEKERGGGSPCPPSRSLSGCGFAASPRRRVAQGPIPQGTRSLAPPQQDPTPVPARGAHLREPALARFFRSAFPCLPTALFWVVLALLADGRRSRERRVCVRGRREEAIEALDLWGDAGDGVTRKPEGGDTSFNRRFRRRRRRRRRARWSERGRALATSPSRMRRRRRRRRKVGNE